MYQPDVPLTSDTFMFADEDCKIFGDRTTKSDFDTKLCSKWDQAMRSGLFRYDLSHIRTKLIDGPHKYVALLNEKRATERRAPEPMHNVNQPFDETKFNFNKVKPAEILFSLVNRDWKSTSNNKLIINVSPVDAAHSLIVPEIDGNLNQNLTSHAIQLALEVMCLSSSSSFKIGFNSLCAHASVNHQHLHCYYTDEVLLADQVPGKLIADGLHALCLDAPYGYGLELRDVKDISNISERIFSCVDHMRSRDVAHSLFICRGHSFTDISVPAVRVLLWPRTKVLGPKPSEAAFNTAVLEMAGHLLIKDEAYYDAITDDSAYDSFRDIMLPENEHEELTSRLVRLCTNKRV